MRRGILALLAAAVAAALSVHPPVAWACTCVQATVAQHFEDADLVFAGTVSTVQRDDEVALASVALEEIFKGRLPRSVDVSTDASEAGCGIPFVAGSRYTVFASVDGSQIVSSSCDGTTDSAAIVDQVRSLSEQARGTPSIEAAPPQEETSSRAGAIAAAVLVLAVGAGMLGYRLLRQRGSA